MGVDAKTKSLGHDARARPMQLIVLDGPDARAHTLPGRGRLVVGRGEDSQVRVDNPSISRRHAVLHVGERVEIEDLGSSNGTQVRGRRLAAGERVPLAVGDMLELGEVVAVLRGPRASDAAPRLATHTYFTARLEAECDRAARGGGGFTVVRARAAAPDDELERRLLAALQPDDVVARYGAAAGDWELLLLDGTERPLPRALRAGRAVYPRDGRTPDALLAAAGAALAPSKVGELVVIDEVMVQLHRALERVAAGNIHILLLGETGSGKEVFAQRIHAASRRAAGPFVSINCAALTETLLESELFGHEKGAFSGALKAKAGLLETAAGGTVFLDEIGELPASLQAKLLRVLEEQCVRPVGGLKPRPIDARFVSATNRDLDAEVAAGRFRNDLYYRLNGFALVIPPLRARPAEIEPLARRFVDAASRAAGRSPPSIADAALALLRAHHWPGNVRELKNTMERAVLLSDGEILPEHLPAERMGGLPSPGEDPERARVVRALEATYGNQTRAAELLGISRRTLVTKLEKHGLPRPRKRT